VKLLSLRVEHFRCVRKAKLEFGPGLNVLYGPNDLGKSSLAAAIRAALLLQSSSKDYEEFLNWGGTGDPQVELVIETEPQRIWRIRKTFGSSPQAFLDESRNGTDFHVEARGRDVDGRLSEILRWGLAPPGGKGRPKGMPLTFLTTALLAEQDRVAAIFDQALSTDSDESGKKRLMEALQAVAEDPLFKLVLGKVQAKVDQAFTETGRRKGGKNSPWTYVRDLIRQKEDYERECNEQAQKSKALEIEIQELFGLQLKQKAAVNEAQESLNRIEENHARSSQRRDILARLQQRNGILAEITKKLLDLAQSEERLVRFGERLAALSTQEQSAQEALLNVMRSTEAAREELTRLQSEDSARERLLKQGSLEKRYAELQREQLQTQAKIERITAVATQTARVHALEDENRTLDRTIKELEQQHDQAAREVQALGKQEHTLRSIGHSLKAQVAQQKIEEAERNLGQITAWRIEASQKRSAALALQNSIPNISLPSPTQLEMLRQLYNELQVARARLDVGLNVLFRPKRELRVSVRRDEESPIQYDLTSLSLETSASREIYLDIEDLAEITFFGGEQHSRDAFQSLQNRWLVEGEPALRLAKVVNLDELANIVASVQQQSTEIQEANRAASQLEQRAADQPDWSDALEQGRLELASADEALRSIDRRELERASRHLGINLNATEIDKQLALLREEQLKRTQIEGRLNGDLIAARAKGMDTRKSLIAANDDLLNALSFVEGESEQALQQVEQRQSTLQAELDTIQAELKALAEDEDKTIKLAQEALATAEEGRRRAEEAHKKTEEDLRTEENNYIACEREVEIRRETATQLDEKAARGAVDEVESELILLPASAYEVSDQMLAEGRKAVLEALGELKKIEEDIQAKRGALQHVGGDVAKQRAEGAEEALKLAREQEQAMESDYAAWELLRNTLREAEQEEGVHLGRALGDPVAERFADLTSGRYGKIALGPNLETHGISASGDDRSVSSLSVGTRDQLSTIFRLSLAEQLQSSVLLDDQLTQSDAERMVWLRNLLRTLATSIQIIVFTCRPGDYLLPDELKMPRDSGGNSCVLAIDLARIIGRATTAASTR
jgi:DNA repair exonuclease SbcCD ATPase subunit